MEEQPETDEQRRDRMLFKYGGWKCSKECMVLAPWESVCGKCGETDAEAFAKRYPTHPPYRQEEARRG